MGPHPDWWEVHDCEIEPRVVGMSDRTDPRHWRIGYGWSMDTVVQAVSFQSNFHGHNRWAWPVQ